ncbi:transketolase [Candidatus Peregrinibacteria bacterium]|nr:MAG: transketolase [Candidatus Peregrinibacteria bacterium]
MFSSFPSIGQSLSSRHIDFLKVFSKSARGAIVQMVTNANSGHPGGSCSVIDYLSLIYAFIVSQTGDPVVVSNGHVSPAVYASLAEMGIIPRQAVIDTFRKAGSIYEGHITRHVKGVEYGTGPLGVGVSVASGFAKAFQLTGDQHRVFGLVGDGEAQEGQVYEMMHFANKYKLSNFTLFVDYNQVQLSDSLKKIMPMDLKKIFESGHWNVLEVDGHDYQALWQAVSKSYTSDRPTVLLGKTIMGKGVEFMEADGRAIKATWHGIAPKPEQTEAAMANELKMTDEENQLLHDFRASVQWHPEDPLAHDIAPLTPMKNVQTGTPRLVPAGETSDCRSAYGKALLDLAKLNDNVVALTADLAGSVKTDVMGKEFPERHIDVGIAEQHMVSCAGGMSFKGLIPFCSTFGAFMSSRAKDQARVNDINRANVKMVATHCGLSVGEDGPTHQAIDDMGSFLGLLNTHVLEPADANQTDHIIRYVASHYGNFYVRMGRHKYSVLTKEDGSVFYDENYRYEYGKADHVRRGDQVTVVAFGSTSMVAMKAIEALKDKVSVDFW